LEQTPDASIAFYTRTMGVEYNIC